MALELIGDAIGPLCRWTGSLVLGALPERFRFGIEPESDLSVALGAVVVLVALFSMGALVVYIAGNGRS